MKIGSLHSFQKSKFTPAFTGVSAGFYDFAVKLKKKVNNGKQKDFILK